MEYLPDGDPEEVEWQDYWDLTNDLPVMARVTLTFGYEHRGEESHTKNDFTCVLAGAAGISNGPP